MPINVNPMMVTAAAGGLSDVYLAVKGEKQGTIKGECTTADHVDAISVFSWNWGVVQPTDSSTGLASRKRSYKNLVVCKGVDAASTKLMNAVANNETVVEAKLTMCKAGGDPLGYFTMTLNGARVTSLEIDVGTDGRPIERVAFAFVKIEVDYVPQTSDGIGGGSTTFSDEWTTPSLT